MHRREPEKFLRSLPQLGVVWFVTIDMSPSRLLILRSSVFGYKSWPTGMLLCSEILQWLTFMNFAQVSDLMLGVSYVSSSSLYNLQVGAG